jgi:hypothetical protein
MNEKDNKLDAHKHSLRHRSRSTFGGSGNGGLWDTIKNVIILSLGLLILGIATIFDKKPEV